MAAFSLRQLGLVCVLVAGGIVGVRESFGENKVMAGEPPRASGEAVRNSRRYFKVLSSLF